MRQLTILALLFCLSLQSSIFQTALSSYSSYTLWKERFGISYSTITEDAYRFAVWLSNSHAIAHHNKHSGATYKMGENQFTAMTSDEFAHYVGQIKIDNRKTQGVSVEVGEEMKTMGPDIDWTTRGAVNPVKYEGQCACSYAYSAAGAIEGQYFLKKGSLINVSWQQFIDCTVTYGNHGCNGGYMTYCFDYARNLGVVNDQAYPYRAYAGKCIVSGGPLKIAYYTQARTKVCEEVENLLAKGPVAVAINALHMQNYHSGVFSDCRTYENPTQGALLVGQTSSIWKVQMNFGTTWGVSGYVYLAPGNTCNICEAASQPTL